MSNYMQAGKHPKKFTMGPVGGQTHRAGHGTLALKAAHAASTNPMLPISGCFPVCILFAYVPVFNGTHFPTLQTAPLRHIYLIRVKFGHGDNKLDKKR